MRSILDWWKDRSISTKLYSIVGLMAVLIAAELFTLRFATNQLSAARALVGGESLWAKAQKDSVFSLQRYGRTRDESDFQNFLNHLKVPEGDHLARVELDKPNPDYQTIVSGFLNGKIHEEDTNEGEPGSEDVVEDESSTEETTTDNPVEEPT